MEMKESGKAQPPTCLLIGRPSRSKRTFLNWYAKEELILDGDNLGKPLLVGNSVAEVLGSLDDCVVACESIVPDSDDLLASGGNTPSTAATLSTSGSSTPNGGGSTPGAVNVVNFSDLKSQSATSKEARVRLPEKVKTVPASACLTCVNTPLLDMNFIVLPALSLREQHRAEDGASLSINDINAGVGSSGTRESKMIDWLDVSQMQVLGWSEAEELLLEKAEEEQLLNQAKRQGEQLVDGVMNSRVMNNQYVNGVRMGVGGLLSITGTNQLIDLTKNQLKEGLSATGMANMLDPTVFGPLGANEMNDATSAADREEIWRQLCSELVQVSQVILVFLEGGDDVKSIIRTISEAVDALNTDGGKQIHYFFPKWDLKTSAARETERSELRTALMRIL